MKRQETIKGILFEVGNQTPRRNEYERGQKYRLFVDGIPTGYTFATIKAAREFYRKNFFIWL